MAEAPTASGMTDRDVAALQRHLAAHLPDVGDALDVRLIAGGRSNPTYSVDDGTHEWVLRRPPHGLVLETAHDMTREYTVMTALRDSAVPVPETVHHCEDPTVIGAPFYLMQRLDGRTLDSVETARSLSPEDRAAFASAMVDTLVALHEVRPEDVGLAGFGRPDGYLERQLRRWRTQWDAAHTVERPEVEELLRRLGDRLPVTTRTGIVHGDYKADNVMVAHEAAGTVVGVLDWEMSTLGDTLADVGLMLSFWDDEGEPFNPFTQGVTAMPGFPTGAEMAATYAERAGLHARGDEPDVAWYVSLADLKIAVILEQIHVRHTAGQTVGEGFAGIGDMVQPLLERALVRLAA